MSNPSSTRASWEQALLNKMTSNGERLAVVENKLESVEKKLESIAVPLVGIEKTNQEIESLLGWLKWIAGGVGAILLSVIANFAYSVIS